MKAPVLPLLKYRTKPGAYVVLVAVIFCILALSVTVVSAHGTVDQSNDPETGTSFGCGVPESIYQSFTVGGTSTVSLVAVDLRLRAGGSFPAEGLTTSARLRESVGGTVLAESSTFLDSPPPGENQLLAHFDFATPPTVNPGDTLLIEWLAPGDVFLTWMLSQDNPYPGGTAFGCSGTAVEDWDFSFITYVESPPEDTTGGPGDTVPANSSRAGEHANSHACEDNPGRANDHRPANVPPCRR